MFVTPAFAQAAAAPGGSAIFAQIMPLVLIFVIMYFLLIRPQQKKAKEHRAMVEALRRGDQVLTQGGILAKVVKVNEDGIQRKFQHEHIQLPEKAQQYSFGCKGAFANHHFA